MSKKRPLKHTIFIACEGKNTERLYFEAIAEETDTAEKFAITVYPDENVVDPTTHALGLVKEAQSRIDDFDEVWVVFDKDGYTKHPDTFAEAAKNINGKFVNIAFSSIAFEQWVLLHFTKSSASYPKSRDIIAVLDANQYYTGYVKTTYQDTYTSLKDKTNAALENAAWLRHQLTIKGELPGKQIYDINPFTDVDRLVRYLLCITEEVVWISLDQTISIGKMDFCASVVNDFNTEITITNRGGTSTFNAVNLDNYFYLVNDAKDRSNFKIDQTITILNGETKQFSLQAAESMTGKTGVFNLENYVLMIEM